MNICIYARVSTTKQDLDQQLQACRRYCEYREFTIAHEYSEIISTKKTKRPQYFAMLQALRSGQYAGVVVFRLDRLGRNSRELALTIDELENKGIKVLSVSEQFDTSTAMGRAMRELIYIFAQLERDQNGEATRQRLAALKASGKVLGRPAGSRDKVRRKKAGYLMRWLNNRPGKHETEAVATAADNK